MESSFLLSEVIFYTMEKKLETYASKWEISPLKNMSKAASLRIIGVIQWHSLG